MVQDESVDFQDTWNFLDRRFQDTKTITMSRQEVRVACRNAHMRQLFINFMHTD